MHVFYDMFHGQSVRTNVWTFHGMDRKTWYGPYFLHGNSTKIKFEIMEMCDSQDSLVGFPDGMWQTKTATWAPHWWSPWSELWADGLAVTGASLLTLIMIYNCGDDITWITMKINEEHMFIHLYVGHSWNTCAIYDIYGDFKTCEPQLFAWPLSRVGPCCRGFEVYRYFGTFSRSMLSMFAPWPTLESVPSIDSAPNHQASPYFSYPSLSLCNISFNMYTCFCIYIYTHTYT